MIRQCAVDSPAVRSLLTKLSEAYRLTYGASDVDPTDLDGALVAFDGRRPVGLIGWKRLSDTTAHLRRLYVVEDARGQRWASRLADAAIATARKEGHAELFYDVDQANEWCRSKGEEHSATPAPPFAPHADQSYVLQLSDRAATVDRHSDDT